MQHAQSTSSDSQPVSQSIGTHRIHVAGDTIEIEYQGPLTIAQSEALFAIVKDQLARHPHVFIVSDARNTVAMSMDVRRHILRVYSQHMLPVTSVIVGGSLFARATLEALFAAVRLVGRAAVPLHFCVSRTEAEALIARERERASLRRSI